MEVDTTTAPKGSPELTDEIRLSAATKRVTLTPLHIDVQPELKPDGSAGGGQGLDIPIANIPSEMERTGASVQLSEVGVESQEQSAAASIRESISPIQAFTSNFLPNTQTAQSHDSKLLVIGILVGITTIGIGAVLWFVTLG
ncbi:MAG: hypothetical protein WBP12_01815 [Candidatus Saccharimonas sp.]